MLKEHHNAAYYRHTQRDDEQVYFGGPFADSGLEELEIPFGLGAATATLLREANNLQRIYVPEDCSVMIR